MRSGHFESKLVFEDQNTGKGSRTLPRIRILMAEDNRPGDRYLEHMLKSTGYDVIGVVSSGKEAVKKAAEFSPDLVLMDIPRGATERIRISEKLREQLAVPAIYLIARADEPALRRARLADPFYYLAKPFHQSELLTAIEMAFYRSQMEMKPKKQERWLSALLNNFEDGLILTDKEGFVSFMNPLAEKLTGWKKEAALGKDLREIFPLMNELGQIVVEKYTTRVLTAGDVARLKDRHLLRSKTGKKIPVYVRVQAVRDESDIITDIIIRFRHIKERKQQDERLRRERETIKGIFASSPDAIMIIGLDLKLKDCNQAASDLLGYSTKEEIIDKDAADFLGQKARQRVREDTRLALEKDLLRDVEYVCQTKNGDTITVLISFGVVRDTSGRPLHFIAVAKDITKIKLSKQMLETIFDGIKDGILIVNTDYQVLRANLEILKIYNKKNFSELLGKNCFSQLYERRAACDHCPAQMAFKSGKAHRTARICRGENKEKKVLDLSAFPIKDPDGKVVQVIIHKRDVTDRIKLEDQLISQERIAAIGELAAGIAHEIRNPLGNIFASVQYCLGKYKLTQDVKKYLGTVLQNTENANRVIRHLLNFARPQEISFEMGDIGKVIATTCDLIKVKSLSQRVRMIRRLPTKLPQVLIDEKRLAEAFSNVILNALDAMPNGGRLTITGHVDFQSEEMAISILDTGKGIPEGDLNKVFDPFFTTKPDGIGLGLCLARQVINDHKGKIEVESRVGQGTEVRVRLPLSRT